MHSYTIAWKAKASQWDTLALVSIPSSSLTSHDSCDCVYYIVCVPKCMHIQRVHGHKGLYKLTPPPHIYKAYSNQRYYHLTPEVMCSIYITYFTHTDVSTNVHAHISTRQRLQIHLKTFHNSKVFLVVLCNIMSMYSLLWWWCLRNGDQ